jgi:cystathionine beta-synthase
MMNEEGISQIPVTENGNIVGSLIDSKILARLVDDSNVKTQAVRDVMGAAFQFVGMDNSVDSLSSLITKDNPALLVRDEANNVHIITQQDLLVALAN